MCRLGTVQEHGICGRDGNVEGTDSGSGVAEGNKAAVQSTGHGTARCRLGRLCHCVVARRELELQHVARVGLHIVGRENKRCAAHHDRYHFVACRRCDSIDFERPMLAVTQHAGSRRRTLEIRNLPS
jgi:hypothetical protein